MTVSCCVLGHFLSDIIIFSYTLTSETTAATTTKATSKCTFEDVVPKSLKAVYSVFAANALVFRGCLNFCKFAFLSLLAAPAF